MSGEGNSGEVRVSNADGPVGSSTFVGGVSAVKEPVDDAHAAAITLSARKVRMKRMSRATTVPNRVFRTPGYAVLAVSVCGDGTALGVFEGNPNPAKAATL